MKQIENNVLLEQHSSAEKTNIDWNFELDNEIKDLEGTPFKMARVEDQYTILLGNYRLENLTKDLEGMLEKWKTPRWEEIMKVIGLMIEFNENK